MAWRRPPAGRVVEGVPAVLAAVKTMVMLLAPLLCMHAHSWSCGLHRVSAMGGCLEQCRRLLLAGGGAEGTAGKSEGDAALHWVAVEGVSFWSPILFERCVVGGGTALGAPWAGGHWWVGAVASSFLCSESGRAADFVSQVCTVPVHFC